jgi:hypothetical protein
MRYITRVFTILAVIALSATSVTFGADRTNHTSSIFTGAKANTGTVNHYYDGNQHSASLR